MIYKNPYVYRISILCFIAILYFSFPTTLLSNNSPNAIDGPVSDSILQKQIDSMVFSLNLEYLNGVNDNKNPYELIYIIEEILDLDPAQYNLWFNLGLEYIKIHEYELAIAALKQGLELYPTEDNPSLLQIYLSLSFCYNKLGKHQMDKENLDIAAQIFPDHPGIVGRYVICAHSRMRYTESDYHKQRLILILRSQEMNESNIAFYLGKLYLTTDYLEAEKYFRTAYQYDPDNIEKLGSLAWVLIRNALKIEEGMSLIEQAIEADPNNAIYIHQQGYGFYMKGKYEDALFNLYNAHKLYEHYSYELDNHILMVEEAIASLEQ